MALPGLTPASPSNRPAMRDQPRTAGSGIDQKDTLKKEVRSPRRCTGGVMVTCRVFDGSGGNALTGRVFAIARGALVRLAAGEAVGLSEVRCLSLAKLVLAAGARTFLDVCVQNFFGLQRAPAS